jgi:hypothetical protein
MKTLASLAIIMTLVVVVPVAYAGNPQNQQKAPLIHYVVTISTNLNPNMDICSSVVMVTDGNGSAVNGSQPFRPYLTTYHFYESGPVYGTREALIMVLPANSDAVCPIGPAPVSQHTTFLNGRTYSYSMFYGTGSPSPIPAPASLQ